MQTVTLMRHPMRKPWTRIPTAVWAAQSSGCEYPVDCTKRASIVGEEGLSLACVLVAEGELDPQQCVDIRICVKGEMAGTQLRLLLCLICKVWIGDGVPW